MNTTQTHFEEILQYHDIERDAGLKGESEYERKI
jgi:hypothetical protein